VKFKKRYAVAVAVALTGAAVAILPMAASNAAEACAPAWSASQV
jgi:chitinase